MLRSRAPSTRPAPGPVSIRRFGRLTGSAHMPRFRLISGLERTEVAGGTRTPAGWLSIRTSCLTSRMSCFSETGLPCVERKRLTERVVTTYQLSGGGRSNGLSLHINCLAGEGRPRPAGPNAQSPGSRRQPCCPASFARKHAAATAIEALGEARPASCSSERRVVELAPVEPGVEPAAARRRRPAGCSG